MNYIKKKQLSKKLNDHDRDKTTGQKRSCLVIIDNIQHSQTEIQKLVHYIFLPWARSERIVKCDL